ncbi:MAG: NADH-quinone oxidoreductase subunit NuoH [Anaerolineae bacterium]
MEGIITWITSLGLDSNIARLLVLVAYGAILALVVAPMTVVVFTYMERKVIARIQDRIGPNRAGPFGVLQALADAVKMISKEDITPLGADRIVYNIAPALAIASSIMIYAVIPLGPGIVGADLDIGVLYIVAVGTLGTFAILMGGWASNNKYALLGAFRVIAQLIAYEIPMVVALITVALAAGSMSLGDIVARQDVWYIIQLPLVFAIFFVASVAETGRSPFDLTEGESEIIAGYHVEYSGFKFALFMLGEYAHMFAVAALSTTLFMGGWRGPGAGPDTWWGVVLGIIYFLIKSLIWVFVMMWWRGTLPRFRIDQLLDFGWKFLVPVSLVILMVVAVLLKVVEPLGTIPAALILLVGNIMTAAVCLGVLRLAARSSRDRALRGIAAVDT